MTQEISELMDGELQGARADQAIRRCCGEAGCRDDWHAYHAIGEVMRGGDSADAGSTRRILEAIRAEPTVLAPRRLRGQGLVQVALAAAASVATVAVVGWIGLQERAAEPATVAATVAPAPAPVAVSEAEPRLQEYVMVHRQVPAADFYRTVASTEPARP